MFELHHAFSVGELCYLRGLEESDINERYLGWLNDFEVTRYLESGRQPSDLADLRAYYENAKNDPKRILFAICDKETGQHIGNASLGDLHWVHRRASFGIIIGEKAFWGRGYGTEVARLIIEYGFRRLNLHSIYLGVLANHTSAIRSYEKVGFQRDGLDREASWTDGAWHDVYRMSILAREYFASAAAKTAHPASE